MKSKNAGLEMKAPEATCNDVKCPYHGSLKLRGRSMNGRVIKKDTHHTATVEFPWTHYIPKYERFEKKRTRIRCHNPACINAGVGDQVTIVECRKLSKTKGFVVVGVIGK